MPPRVIIGAGLFNHAKDFPEAIESILSQTFTDFALVLVDDCSTDETPALAQEYAARDPRVTYLANPERLGLVENSRHVFRAARERYPDAEYFAWASDHDVWHPRWLQQLVDVLETQKDVVLAYPLNRRIGASGEVLARKPWAFDTAGMTSRWARLTHGLRFMSAGNMVYGLFRIAPLERSGVYRKTLVPDRLLFTELALYGQFRQVPQVLWFRRWYGRVFSLGRQRKSFFPGGRPAYMYVPWWISHGASLFWTLTIRGDGRPEVGRATGAIVAIWCLLFSGLLHLWQSLRALRFYLLEAADWLRPYERRVRLVFRAMGRQGIGDWMKAHMTEALGAKARRRKLKALKKGVASVAFESVRRPGLWLLRALRSIPVVRNRVIPSLLKKEIDQIPAAPAAAAVKRDLQRLQQTEGPLIIGPWVGEVGFELLYWIPFLNWALAEYGLAGRRLIVVSRGGARPWYQHLTSEYVDVFDLFTIEEYRQANEERWGDAGHQKQYRVEELDRDIVERVKARLGLPHAELLHPSLMYRLLRFYWFEKAGVGLLTRHTEYRKLAPMARSAALSHLPADYIAARFYFRPSFPDTPANRQFAANVIRSIAREMPVVLLNTGLKLDEHEDLNIPGAGVHHVDRLMTPERNLEVQTEIISHSRGFVGTYGGLSYLGPFFGVPSIGFYSTESELIPAHLDVSWRLGRTVGTPVAAVHTGATDLLRTAIGGWSGLQSAAREEHEAALEKRVGS